MTIQFRLTAKQTSLGSAAVGRAFRSSAAGNAMALVGRIFGLTDSTLSFEDQSRREEIREEERTGLGCDYGGIGGQARHRLTAA